MKRKLIVTSLLICFFFGSVYAQNRVISVLYFENTTTNSEYAWLSRGLADMLITEIAIVKDLSVIEREEIQKILKEQERAMSDLYDEQSAARIGALVAAREIIIGSFIIQQPTLRIDVKIVNVESGKVEKAVTSQGDLKNLFQVQNTLAAGVMRELGVTLPVTGPSGTTASVDAARAYYTGIEFLDDGAFDKAAESFQQAIKFDPYYLKPRKSLEDAYRFLKDFKKQRYQRELNALYVKAVQLKERLASPTWMTYAEFLTDCYNKGLSQEEIKKLTDANPSYFQGDTRAQCTWNLEGTLLEIADMAEEYFGDEDTVIRMHKEILYIADQARSQFKDDPFFPEIIYMTLFSIQYFEQWDVLMRTCEYLMENFPDYRMMWAIEGFYERALEAQGFEIDDD